MKTLLQQGWECPKCGAVMSPHKDVCVNCTGKVQVTVGYTGDIPPYNINQGSFNIGGTFIPIENGGTDGKPKEPKQPK